MPCCFDFQFSGFSYVSSSPRFWGNLSSVSISQITSMGSVDLLYWWSFLCGSYVFSCTVWLWRVTCHSLGYSTTFDRVWHETLLEWLLSYGIPPSLSDIILSLLSDRIVCYCLWVSLSFQTDCGVSQGSILSSSLWYLLMTLSHSLRVSHCDANDSTQRFFFFSSPLFRYTWIIWHVTLCIRFGGCRCLGHLDLCSFQLQEDSLLIYLTETEFPCLSSFTVRRLSNPNSQLTLLMFLYGQVCHVSLTY